MRPQTPLDAHHPRVVHGGIEHAAWLRGELAKLGLTAIDAARLVGIRPETVRGYLRGFAVPSATTLKTIERVVGTNYRPSDESAETALGAHAAVRAGVDCVTITVTVRIERQQLAELLAA